MTTDTVEVPKLCETCGKPLARKHTEGRAAFARRRTCSWECRMARVPKVCSVEGCAKAPKTLGMCHGHYQRSRRGGNVDGLLRDDDPTRAARLFWSKVDKGSEADCCWLWTSEVNNKGYGVHRIWRGTGGRRCKKVLAHRHAYAETTGEEISGRVLLHSCDNPPCVNPAHLRPGTQAENIEDARSKGRMVAPPHLPGSRHPGSRLTEPDVIEILGRLRAGESQVSIAGRFGVSHGAVSQIKCGKSWKHVPRDFEGAA